MKSHTPHPFPIPIQSLPCYPSLSLARVLSCVGLSLILMMELQLGLAPPNHLIKGFDLNSPREMMGSTVWAHGQEVCSNKRDFDEAFDSPRGPIKTLRLLWNDQSDGEDSGDDGETNIAAHSFFQLNKRNIVGWPPIKASRKTGYGGGLVQREGAEESKGAGYVKVMMEGVAIGRKVDLTVHDSFHALTRTLSSMFGIYDKGGKGPGFKIAYQDKQGDWLLVGDVPWGTFVQRAQRLKMQKKRSE